MSKILYIWGGNSMKKSDEMQLHIELSAMKWAWAFDVAVLLVWGVWDRARTGHFTGPMYLLVLQNLLYLVAVQIGKWRVGDEEGRRGLAGYLAAAAGVLLLGGALMWLQRL